jgi:serralysin
MNEDPKRFCVCLTGKQVEGTKAALLNAARWPTGTQVTVKFLEGKSDLQRKVQAVVKKWTDSTNVQFVFQNSGDTDIRIAFRQGAGSWSYLGTQCRTIPQDKPTMNFGWLTSASGDIDIQSVVLHEFGHSLGLIHEHQNPVGGIQWNRDAVIRDLSGPPNNWSLQTVENNIFATDSMSDVTATAVDPKSIMMYMIPRSWTLDGFSSGQNDDLSQQDIAFIKTIYPK